MASSWTLLTLAFFLPLTMVAGTKPMVRREKPRHAEALEVAADGSSSSPSSGKESHHHHHHHRHKKGMNIAADGFASPDSAGGRLIADLQDGHKIEPEVGDLNTTNETMDEPEPAGEDGDSLGFLEEVAEKAHESRVRDGSIVDSGGEVCEDGTSWSNECIWYRDTTAVNERGYYCNRGKVGTVRRRFYGGDAKTNCRLSCGYCTPSGHPACEEHDNFEITEPCTCGGTSGDDVCEAGWCYDGECQDMAKPAAAPSDAGFKAGHITGASILESCVPMPVGNWIWNSKGFCNGFFADLGKKASIDECAAAMVSHPVCVNKRRFSYAPEHSTKAGLCYCQSVESCTGGYSGGDMDWNFDLFDYMPDGCDLERFDTYTGKMVSDCDAVDVNDESAVNFNGAETPPGFRADPVEIWGGTRAERADYQSATGRGRVCMFIGKTPEQCTTLCTQLGATFAQYFKAGSHDKTCLCQDGGTKPSGTSECTSGWCWKEL